MTETFLSNSHNKILGAAPPNSTLHWTRPRWLPPLSAILHGVRVRAGELGLGGPGMKLVSTIVAIGLLLGCGVKFPSGVPARPSPATRTAFRLQLSLQGCFGPCPQYDLTVSGDGTAVIRSKRFMPFEGRATARMNAEYLRKLVRSAGFQSFACESVVPDAELVRLTVVDGANQHTVACSLAGRETAPLSDLTAGIHKAVMQARWRQPPKREPHRRWVV
jgi:hypothetical protein